MNSFYRPSLGVISIMMALNEKPEATVLVDGIGVMNSSGDRYAYYMNQQKLKYKQDAHFLDKLYLSLLLKKFPKLSIKNNKEVY